MWRWIFIVIKNQTVYILDHATSLPSQRSILQGQTWTTKKREHEKEKEKSKLERYIEWWYHEWALSFSCVFLNLLLMVWKFITLWCLSPIAINLYTLDGRVCSSSKTWTFYLFMSSFLRKIIRYSGSTLNAYSLFSQKWWISSWI